VPGTVEGIGLGPSRLAGWEARWIGFSTSIGKEDAIISLWMINEQKQRGQTMIRKEFIETDAGPIARVTFILPSSMWADTICLVGDFNGWNLSSHPFQHDRQDMWTITVDLEVNRSYQFRYWRDGEWMNDGQADAYVHNRFGSDNFVVVTDPNFKPYHG
jgi:predicted carbohydrate-binding protein with CBM48